MGQRPIQQKNGPLTTEIAILNLERMAHWNFKFICNKLNMAHTMVFPAVTLELIAALNGDNVETTICAWQSVLSGGREGEGVEVWSLTGIYIYISVWYLPDLSMPHQQCSSD